MERGSGGGTERGGVPVGAIEQRKEGALGRKKEAPTGGTGVSAAQRKRKGGRELGLCGRERDGLVGRLGRRGVRSSSFFLFFKLF
jgi:hypothetical protein